MHRNQKLLNKNSASTLLFFLRCEDCLLLDVTLERTRLLIESCNLSTDHRRRLLAAYNHHVAMIEAWKCHQLRAVVQDEARTDVVDLLNDSNVS
jgi:hypothetical protein